MLNGHPIIIKNSHKVLGMEDIMIKCFTFEK